MWNTITQTLDAAYQFILQGRPPQEVMPIFMLGVLALVAYMLVRISRGNAK